MECDAEATDLCMMQHQTCDKTSMVLRRAEEAKQQARRQFRREAAMLDEMTSTLDAVKTALHAEGDGGVVTRVQGELAEFTSSKQALDKVRDAIVT